MAKVMPNLPVDMQTTDLEASDGRSPLVLLHGATSSSRAWDGVIPLVRPHLAVFAPTLAGHLGGPPLSVAPPLVVSGIVDSLCRTLDDAGIDKAHLVGNSLGGWVALELARRGRARSVVAFSPAGAWRTSRDLTRLLRIFRLAAAISATRAARSLSERERVRRIAFRTMAYRADKMTPVQVADMFDDMAGCAVLRDLLDGARTSGAMAPFSSLDCPVLIAWGQFDRTLPFARYGVPMLAAVPGAELVIVPGVGHVPMIDDPEIVANMVVDFVSRPLSEVRSNSPTHSVGPNDLA
jgi:pimeloyl-ACP methyl ester carboxylesterase